MSKGSGEEEREESLELCPRGTGLSWQGESSLASFSEH